MTKKAKKFQHQIQAQVSYSDDGTYMYLKVPFNREFLDAIKASVPKYARLWNPNDKTWRIEGGYHSIAKELIDTYFEGDIDSTSALPDAELYRALYLIPGAPMELVVQAYGILSDKYKDDMAAMSRVLTAYSTIMDKLNEIAQKENAHA